MTLLALASGTALCGVVGWSVVRTAAQAREREELASRRDAHDLAIAMRAVLQNPAVLATVPTEQQFVVQDGSVVVDAAVGWLQTRATPPPDTVVDGGLRAAQHAEFIAHDAAAARAQFDELLGPRRPQGDDALPVLVAAAWQAQRAAQGDRAAPLVASLLAALQTHAAAGVADARVANAVVAIALLHAARGEALPQALVPLLAALPLTLAAPTFARLHERGVDVTTLRAAHTATTTRRALLHDAATTLRTLPQRTTTIAVDRAFLLWFPNPTARGDGQGALVQNAWLAALPGLGTARPSPTTDLPPLPARGTVQFTPQQDAEELLPDAAWIAPLPPPEPAWFARPQAIVTAGLVLVAVFAASAFAMLRAARRETLALRTRADFLTGVTHELKTPIAAIRLTADVLLDDDVPPARQRAYFGLLAGETARLSALVDNVLDLGQIERGERAYDLQPGDLADVVRDVATLFTPLAQRAGMQLHLHEGATTMPTTLDANALRQALLAVCENARKYATTGQRLDLTTQREPDAFTIRIRDCGPGIAADESDAIFERFQRGRRHRSGAIPGVGLGLFLARSIVARHGGTLRCQTPADGPGAEFVFTFPLPEASA